VACERAVLDGFGAGRAFVCRAGLIIGPEDDSGRFTYWVDRIARGGEVLAPGTPGELVQFVDVADLAAWIVTAAETALAGVFDGIGEAMPRSQFLDRVAAGVDSRPTFTWVVQDFLLEHEVKPWMGPGALPLWLPLPRYAGFMTRDVSASLAVGLRTRDVAETARRTLGWMRGAGVKADGAGLEPAREVELLEIWHGRF
jgi:nucleoside-diphosphate-sugar epimerase